MTKPCKRCGKEKDINQFYKHSGMADGHLNICIECTKKRVHRYRQDNIESIREYDRERGKSKSSADRRRKYLQDLKHDFPERYRSMRRLSVNKYRQNNRDKAVAHDRVFYAVSHNKLIKMACVICGNANAEAHHEDYSKPLEVVWLCDKCHKKRHLELKAKNRAS